MCSGLWYTEQRAASSYDLPSPPCTAPAGQVNAAFADYVSSLHAGKAMSLAMTAHWVCNFAVGQFFDYARVQWGAAGIFAFFGAMCAVAVVFIKSVVPETKGRSLEEVQAMLA